LKHFNASIKERTISAYCLLIINSYKSYNSVEFKEYCVEHKIITLCMPLHLLHLLQLLNVACFSPLKRAYLIKYSSKQIKKEAFLPAFKAAFKRLITKENICVGFRGARLVLHNLEVVILKLNIVLCT
ncbi:uncharacterized protein M421DRAFT_27168, partial [Didymella exigua CBS 183.55]